MYGIFTRHLTDCSAFCLLYRGPGAAWSRASLIHMMGGPDPNAVNWAAMIANMPNVPNATFYAVLANSRATILSAGFIQAMTAQYPFIPNGHIFVYNQNVMAINFGVDWGAFAGQP